MGLFSKLQKEQILAAAKKSQQTFEQKKPQNARSIKTKIEEISATVIEHFKDSQAILISTPEQLHEYIDAMIATGIGAIDTETTGLDRLKDTIVGVSLYYKGGVECYIPIRHIVPIFDTPYKNQLTYEQVGFELQRLIDNKVKLVLANADFDNAMIYKDLHVDISPIVFYDVILAWRVLKENEQDNSLKGLYSKYVMKGTIDRMKFSDFFTADLFPYCDPNVAKLYAAADAIYTFKLFLWQLPYIQKSNPKCKKYKFEAIADLIWGVEFPLMTVCQQMHRTGIYLEQSVADRLRPKYNNLRKSEFDKLRNMVKELLEDTQYHTSVKCPFPDYTEFNPNSPPHVQWLLYDYLKVENDAGGKKQRGTSKEILEPMGLPITKQILKCRSLVTLIGTFIDKLPTLAAETPDSRIHCEFKQIGADTGRFSSQQPNMQNIPSHISDIRHMFRATPGYVMMSSDYSQQEPKLTAYISGEPKMIETFKNGRDIYATIGSIAFEVPYEDCLEFHPVTHEYQPEGKLRRTRSKPMVLGINYGMEAKALGEKIFGDDDSISEEEKTATAKRVFDAVLEGFSTLKKAIASAKYRARTIGYTETILGRRRHFPNAQLPLYEFTAMKGYVNPDIDPLNPETFNAEAGIPKRIQDKLYKELSSYKHKGQVYRRIKELAAEGIKVTRNENLIKEAERQSWNHCLDYDTEILTTSGWKRHDEVQIGDEILSYNMNTQHIELDTVLSIYDNPDVTDVVRFKSQSFEMVSTEDHRWVVGKHNEVPYIKTTADICRHKYADYPILRVADNNLQDNPNMTDDMLKFIGWYMTDGTRNSTRYGIRLYQSTTQDKNRIVYESIIRVLRRLQLPFTDTESRPSEHTIYVGKTEFTEWVYNTFPDRILTYSFISTLSQTQATVLMQAMLQGDGTGVNGFGEFIDNKTVSLYCRDKYTADVFQYLCFIAGFATNAHCKTLEQQLHNYERHKDVTYATMHNKPKPSKDYYVVTVLRIKRAQIYAQHRSKTTTQGVWCVTTNNSTWVCRRNGVVTITGNCVQGKPNRLNCSFTVNPITQGCSI